mgnify:CR=1 FL=1
MSLGVLTLHLRIPGCSSLKEKRSQIKPLLARLHREFNISAAELDYHDRWGETLIGCSLLSNDHNHTQRTLIKIVNWVETHQPHLYIIEDQIEII